MVAPMMQRVREYQHYFFVPFRLLWANWSKYITGNEGAALPAFPFFWMNDINCELKSLSDYLGLPIVPTGGYTDPPAVSAMFHAAYQLTWDRYYRDQNLIAQIVPDQGFPLVDGDNSSSSTLFSKRRRAWRHDYFTSCLPFAQKGSPVEIPVVANFEDVGVYVNNFTGANLTNSLPPNPLQVAGHPATPPIPADTMFAATSDLDVQATTINDLRVAYSLQEWLEKQARGGSRYDENILVFFGVKTEDYRLQLPEFIVGTSTDIFISEVLQTSSTDGTSPQGNMAGHGFATTSGKYGSYYCKEHGIILGIKSIIPEATYQQGIPRQFLKIDDPYQFFWPQFEHLGEQEILSKELFTTGIAADDNETFGYLPRYAEYRVANSRVSGEFRTSLNFWHWGRIFAARPVLDQAFIECNPDYRPFAVTSELEDHFLCDHVHDISAVRPMGKYGTPTF